MLSLYIYNKVNKKPVRKLISNIPKNENISELRRRVSSEFGLKKDEAELIFGGQQLHDNKSLESYGVKSGVTIHLLKKPMQQNISITDVDKLENEVVSQVITAFRSSLVNPAFKISAEKVLQDRNTVEKLVMSIPNLRHDHFALALLESPSLLLLLAMNTDSLKRTVEAHPTFGQAIMLLVSTINEESRRAASNEQGQESRDAMDDVEIPGSSNQANSWRSLITPDQLAAALASTSAHPTSSASGMHANPATSASGPSVQMPAPSGNSLITADFFRQAMQAVAPSSAVTSSAPSSTVISSLQEQLNQIREMGITDEVMARRALEVTGGNVQEALELIFGGWMNNTI